MRTYRTPVLLLSVFAIAFGLGVLLTPAPAAADCWCTQTATTAEYMGEGTSCTSARADLESQLDAAAGCSSFCLRNVVITNACHWCECHSAYHVHGYLQYQCYACSGGGGGGPGGDPLPK